MRRRLFTLALFLLLGAVVNVVVAWGCAAWLEPGSRWEFGQRYVEPGLYWSVSWYQRWGFTRVKSWWSPGPRQDFPLVATRPRIPSWGGIQVPDPLIDPFERWEVSDAFGWPYLAMRSGFDVQSGGDSPGPLQSKMRGLQLTPINVSAMGLDGRALPLLPIWPGFAFDTAFYGLFSALLWLLLFRGSSGLRRVFRRRRGLCVACGYDLRHADHAACPECGVGPNSATA